MSSPFALARLFLAVLTTGCATMSNPTSRASLFGPGADLDPRAETQTNQPERIPPPFGCAPGPRSGGFELFQPMTGGAPQFGMSLGGNFYLPATGGSPVMGTSQP
jgi:hypothetical protein